MTQTKASQKSHTRSTKSSKTASLKTIKKSVRQSLPLHKRIVLHPVSVLTLLCIGVFISGWSYEALADTYTVTAVVPAAPLTQGAVITSPTDGTTVTSAATLVSGNCPSGAYIKLYTNNTFSGVTFCQNNGSFSLSDDLYIGQNDLVAQDYNVTNQAGPATPKVTVDYVPQSTTPSPPASTSGSETTTTGSNTVSTGSSTVSGTDITPGLASVAPSMSPLLLTSNYQYQTSAVSSNFSWQVDVQGGTPPYHVTVNWGDGTSSSLVFNTDPIFTITHHYSVVGYYAIKVSAVDKTGGVRFIQLAARIVRPNTTGNLSTTNTNYSLPVINHKTSSMFFTNTKGWLWLAWPSFLVVVAMVFSFWLGERQELLLIYRKHRLHTRQRSA